MIDVEVLTTEVSPDNPMHDAFAHFEPKEVVYNINVYKNVIKDVNKDVNEDLNEDEFVSEDVNNDDIKVINDDMVDEIFVVRKIPKKRKKTTPIIEDHDVKELVTYILDVIDDDEKINYHIVKYVINVKTYIEGKNLPKNTPFVPFDNVSFHSKYCIAKWNFVYYRRMTLEKESCEAQ